MLDRRFLSPAEIAGASPEKFEDLLGRLEQIVTDLENADLPLEKLLATYEEGMRLVKSCGERLTEAEQKVEYLSKPAATDPPKSSPGLAGATGSATTDSAAADDIRLF